MKRRWSVVVKERLGLAIMALVWAALAGFATDVHPQDSVYGLTKPSLQESKKARTGVRPRQYPTALAGLEVVADLTVSPVTYAGPCPAALTFKGKITVNRPVTVHYRFIRSDDTRRQPGVLTFDRPGTQEVTDVWQLGKEGGSAELNGWSAIQISFPVKSQSNTAYFRGRCSREGQSATAVPSGQDKDPKDPSLMSSPPPPPPPRKSAPVRPSGPRPGSQAGPEAGSEKEAAREP